MNTAARLESYDKGSFTPDFFDATCCILVGDSTVPLVDDSFEGQVVGEDLLKGKTEATRIYDVTGKKRASSGSHIQSWIANAPIGWRP